MKFGVFLIAPGRFVRAPRDVYRDVLEDAVLAERLGYDSVWFAEHHFDADFCLTPSPNLMAAAAATHTDTIRIGLAVNVLPLHHPLRLAEEGAMLDVMSGGRLIWGIGRGVTRKEFDPWSVPLDESRERALEVHDAVLRLWTEAEVHAEGRTFRIAGASPVPRPVQRPHPEVWTVATSPDSVRWAAERRYAFMQVARPLEPMAESWAIYAERFVRLHGREPDGYGIVPLHYLHLDRDGPRARAQAEPYMRDFWEHFAQIGGTGQAAAAPVRGYEFAAETRALRARMGYEDIVDQGIAHIGTPDEVTDAIRREGARLPLRYMLCDFWRAAPDRQLRHEAMRLFATEVMPQLRQPA